MLLFSIYSILFNIIQCYRKEAIFCNVLKEEHNVGTEAVNYMKIATILKWFILRKHTNKIFTSPTKQKFEKHIWQDDQNNQGFFFMK